MKTKELKDLSEMELKYLQASLKDNGLWLKQKNSEKVTNKLFKPSSSKRYLKDQQGKNKWKKKKWMMKR